MPELPELTILGQQMDKEIKGKQISEVEVFQPKCLNMPPKEFTRAIANKTIGSITIKGKWLFLKLHPGYELLLNLGMGGDLLYFLPDGLLPKKYQFKLTFTDGSGFTIRFWWFGYIHLARDEELTKHKLTGSLGVSPLDKEFTPEYLRKLLEKNNRSTIKPFLLNQNNTAGIGNFYIQDILFKSKLHPKRKISSLTDQERDALHNSIKEILNLSIQLGGSAFEKNFYGQRGKYGIEEILVGYKQGKPCPVCLAPIEKIKTGNTSTFICSNCQKF